MTEAEARALLEVLIKAILGLMALQLVLMLLYTQYRAWQMRMHRQSLQRCCQLYEVMRSREGDWTGGQLLARLSNLGLPMLMVMLAHLEAQALVEETGTQEGRRSSAASGSRNSPPLYPLSPEVMAL